MLNILGEATVLEVAWEPVNIFIFLEHQRLGALDLKEPTRDSPVHDALLGARVERIFVTDILDLPGDALFFEILGDKLVVIPHLKTVVDSVGIVAVIIDGEITKAVLSKTFTSITSFFIE